MAEKTRGNYLVLQNNEIIKDNRDHALLMSEYKRLHPDQGEYTGWDITTDRNIKYLASVVDFDGIVVVVMTDRSGNEMELHNGDVNASDREGVLMGADVFDQMQARLTKKPTHH